MSFMGKAGLAVAALGLAAGSVFGAGAAQAQSLHAAIAFSDLDWAYSYSVNEPTAEAADSAALAGCTASDCHIWAAWSNGCGVIVEGEEGSIGVGTGATSGEAANLAYASLGELEPRALLATTGSAGLSGARVITTICTANAR
ncbi:DUF4189 domain-containing protein [Nocardia rhizosphaerae]|uniref:DUF4189 domain-containing protein n=1 Tax=Nocardia rhizosphaerae TaxID=1691571 RepID=A0ABV8L872_9NOCA